MKKLRIADAFTDHDGYLDTGRVLGWGITLTACGLSIYDVAVLQHAFKVQDFGTGMAALLAGIGAVLWGDGKAKESYNDASPARSYSATTEVHTTEATK